MGALVHEIMRRDFIRANAEESLESVRQTMRLARLRHLPVTCGDRLVGILSYRDLLERLLDSNAAPAATLGDAMHGSPLCVTPETPLGEAADRMCRYGLGCLPVVLREGQLVGLITEQDLLRAAYR